MCYLVYNIDVVLQHTGSRLRFTIPCLSNMQSVHLHNTQQTERGDVDLRGGRMSENVFLTGNSSTLQSPNNCATFDAVDIEGCTALHYTCRGAKYETITMLLETYGAVSVSKRNAHGKLPIDLLFESSEGLDRDSVEYTERLSASDSTPRDFDELQL
eukprot:scaffold2089_cov125-Skeletonema_dohrnii-CCMP3373.AAC.4